MLLTLPEGVCWLEDACFLSENSLEVSVSLKQTNKVCTEEEAANFNNRKPIITRNGSPTEDTKTLI